MLDIKQIKNDKEVVAIMDISEQQIEALGFTEHSVRHSSIVSKWSGEILRQIGMKEREIRLAEIAGYLHDIGNAVSRVDHAMSGALLSYKILTRMGMEYYDAADIMMAIGNHDEQTGLPVSHISAALIIADKADVHKSRVRKNIVAPPLEQNIHDRVNLAAESSHIIIDEESKEIRLEIVIDTTKSSVMDYFEIYFNRMQLCRRAAEFLGRHFSLVINSVKLI
jgi:hypothetical protein